MVQVGEQNGLRFPREFALLVKQLLYFDRQVSPFILLYMYFDDIVSCMNSEVPELMMVCRYNRILAPQLSMLQDDRINFS